MTKREICERLIILYADVNSLQTQIGAWNEPLDDAERDIRKAILDLAAPEEKEAPRRAIGKKEDVPHRDWLDYDFIGPVCENCGVRTYKVKHKDVFACPICFKHRGAFTAAPKEEPKAEEKHPGVIAKPGKDGEIEWCWCQKCYAQAAVVHNPFGDGENWGYCQKCGVSFRLKLGEGEK